jgi:hypothetical protein
MLGAVNTIRDGAFNEADGEGHAFNRGERRLPNCREDDQPGALDPPTLDRLGRDCPVSAGKARLN